MSHYLKHWDYDREDQDLIHVQFDDFNKIYNMRVPAEAICLRARITNCTSMIGLKCDEMPIMYLLDQAKYQQYKGE